MKREGRRIDFRKARRRRRRGSTVALLGDRSSNRSIGRRSRSARARFSKEMMDRAKCAKVGGAEGRLSKIVSLIRRKSFDTKRGTNRPKYDGWDDRTRIACRPLFVRFFRVGRRPPPKKKIERGASNYFFCDYFRRIAICGGGGGGLLRAFFFFLF